MADKNTRQNAVLISGIMLLCPMLKILLLMGETGRVHRDGTRQASPVNLEVVGNDY